VKAAATLVTYISWDLRTLRQKAIQLGTLQLRATSSPEERRTSVRERMVR